MNLLAKCSEGKNPSYLSVDLLPNESIKQTLTNLGNIYSIRSMWKLENFLTGLFPKKIGISLLRQSGVTVSMDGYTDLSVDRFGTRKLSKALPQLEISNTI